MVEAHLAQGWKFLRSGSSHAELPLAHYENDSYHPNNLGA